MGAWAITRRSAPVEQVKKVARREVERVERVVANSSSGRVAAGLAATDRRSSVRDHSRERAHLDIREREMGPRRGVGPVAGHTSAMSARRATVRKESLARSDPFVVCRLWSKESQCQWKRTYSKYFAKLEF